MVYGGGSIGLMGLVSHAVHAGGRHVIGLVSISSHLRLSTCLAVLPRAVLLCLVFCGALALWSLGILYSCFQQLPALERQPWLQKWQLWAGRQALLPRKGASHAGCIWLHRNGSTFWSSFRKPSWFHAQNGRLRGTLCSPASR